MEKREKPGFMLYHDKFAMIDKLPDDQFHAIMHAVYAYSMTHQEPDFDNPALAVIFDMWRDLIDKDTDRYNARAEAGRYAAKVRWNNAKPNANACERIESHENASKNDANACEPMRTDAIYANNQQSSVNNQQSTINDGERVGRSRASRRFTPPTVDDVRAYCNEHGYGIDPEHFVDYYESNGWRVGKNPMRDWKACVRTWVKNEYSRKGGNTNAVDSRPVTEEDLFAGLTQEQIALYEQLANDGEHYG